MALKIVVTRGKRTGAEFVLEGREVFTIGSAVDAQLRIEEAEAAHARIFVDVDRLILMDETGRGVVVNGRPQTQSELRAGDEIAFGQTVLKVSDGKSAPRDGAAAKSAPPKPAAKPAAKAPAELAILEGPDVGHVVPLAANMTLGRSASADLSLNDMKCSREHCRIERRGAAFVLVDLGSTNGTRLNQVKLESKSTQELRHGDKLKLGATVIEFRVAGQPIRSRPMPAPPPAPRPTPPPSGSGPGKVFEIDLDAITSETPPTSLRNPAADRAAADKQNSVTQRVPRSEILKGLKAAGGPSATLEGDLEKMGFAQVVQFLNMSQKSGELMIRTPGGDAMIYLQTGAVIDSTVPAGGPAEQCFYRIARLKVGHFEFHEKPVARDVRIKQGTLALLMEAMRLVDEATDPGD